jgi:hypothetical protein
MLNAQKEQNAELRRWIGPLEHAKGSLKTGLGEKQILTQEIAINESKLPSVSGAILSLSRFALPAGAKSPLVPETLIAMRDVASTAR